MQFVTQSQTQTSLYCFFIETLSNACNHAKDITVYTKKILNVTIKDGRRNNKRSIDPKNTHCSKISKTERVENILLVMMKRHLLSDSDQTPRHHQTNILIKFSDSQFKKKVSRIHMSW